MVSLILGLIFTIILGGFIVALVDISNESYENWKREVTAEDLRQLGEYIRK
jgi:hypothetical protein